jgi:hypothetical protein
MTTERLHRTVCQYENNEYLMKYVHTVSTGFFSNLTSLWRTGGRRKLHNEKLHNLYSSPVIIRMIKLRSMRWAGHVARMGEKRHAYRVLGNPEGKGPLGRPRHRWVDNIKMDLREIGWRGMDWIDLTQDRDQWRALVNAVMNLRVP